jgi:chaperonin GroES
MLKNVDKLSMQLNARNDMGKYSVIPHGDHVLIEKEEAAEVTKGGIVIPQSAREQAGVGWVRAVGKRLNPQGDHVPYDFKVGDRVFINQFAGKKCNLDGDEYWIYPAGDILGTVVPKVVRGESGAKA